MELCVVALLQNASRLTPSSAKFCQKTGAEESQKTEDSSSGKPKHFFRMALSDL